MKPFHIVAGLICCLAFSASFAAETVDWGTSGQVTYSVFVGSIPLGIDSNYEPLKTTVNLSQFNAAAVAQAKGGSASEYTLSRVVLTIDGSIVGNVEYVNNSDVNNTPVFRVSGSSALTFDTVSTSAEVYSKYIPYSMIEAGGRMTAPISELGSGAVSTPEITSDLQRFIGDNTIATSVEFPVDVFFSVYGSDYTSTIAVAGAAGVSATYYYNYDPVPEPSALALLGFGCAVVLIRRRKIQAHS